MKRIFISFFVAATCFAGLTAQTLTVTHNETGKMADEITAALGSTAPAEIVSLIVEGSAYVNFADCGAIATRFPTTALITLDLSGAKFENDSIPGSELGSSVGAFDVSGNGMQVQEIKLPADLKIIGARAFRKFGKLKTMALPEGLIKLGEGCFTGCGSIDYAEFPSTLKTIEAWVFYQAFAMKSLRELPEGLEGVIGASAFAQTSVAVEYIPEGVTEIGASAFNAATRAVSLQALTMYKNIEKIGSKAFQNQAQLRNIEVNRMTPPETAADAFVGVLPESQFSEIELYIPQGSKEAYDIAPWNLMTIYDVLNPPSSITIESKSNVQVSVYPNPAVNTITVTLADDMAVKSAKVVDLSGRTVKYLDASASLTFDVSELVGGIYFLQLDNNQAVKFIKK